MEVSVPTPSKSEPVKAVEAVEAEPVKATAPKVEAPKAAPAKPSLPPPAPFRPPVRVDKPKAAPRMDPSKIVPIKPPPTKPAVPRPDVVFVSPVSVDPEFGWDVRVLEHQARRGKLNGADVKAHLSTLADDAAEGVEADARFSTPFADKGRR